MSAAANRSAGALASRAASRAARRALGRVPALEAALRVPFRAAWRRLNARRHRLSEAWFESIAGTLAEDPCIRVAEFGGEFFVDARSALFRRVVRSGGLYEPELSALCASRIDPERDVLDVGANIGFHAVLFGRGVTRGRVLAVEPTARAFARLERNVARNGVDDRVILHRGAVSDAAGHLEIKTVPGREEFSTLGELAHPAVAGEDFLVERVTTTPLDELVERHGLSPGFMKVDVEGAEHLVFGGAERVLAEHRPVILSELSDALLARNGSSAAEVIARIEGHGYTVTDPFGRGGASVGRDFGDILCVPRS